MTLSTNDAQILALAGLGFSRGSISDLQNAYFQTLADIAILDCSLSVPTDNSEQIVEISPRSGIPLPSGISMPEANTLRIDKSFGPSTVFIDTFSWHFDMSEASSPLVEGSSVSAYMFVNTSVHLNSFALGVVYGNLSPYTAEEELTELTLDNTATIISGLTMDPGNNGGQYIEFNLKAASTTTPADDNLSIPDGIATSEFPLVIKHYIP